VVAAAGRQFLTRRYYHFIKRKKTLNYTKPQLTILGDATKFIAITGFKPLISIGDDFALLRHILPAYDLDE
jgi:hypothetical protein